MKEENNKMYKIEFVDQWINYSCNFWETIQELLKSKFYNKHNKWKHIYNQTGIMSIAFRDIVFFTYETKANFW